MTSEQKFLKTPIQVKKIDKILKRAAEAETLIDGMLAQTQCLYDYDKGQQKCETIGRCAIGELLFRAGFKDETLAEGDVGESLLGSKAAKALFKHYGLTPSITAAIESVNDDSGDEDRYESVVAFVEFSEAMRQQGVEVTGSDDYKWGFYGWEYDDDYVTMQPVDVPAE